MTLKSILGRFALLFLLACTSSAAMSFTRYSKPVPEGLVVCETREQMNQAARDHPETVLHDEDGGYYLKDMNGIPVAVAADSLCPELDKSFAEADTMIAQNQLEGEDQMGTDDGLDSTAETVTYALLVIYASKVDLAGIPHILNGLSGGSLCDSQIVVSDDC
ncbi:hypothetical protein AFLA70_282g001201 [Aspergillus flavus AF70]|nr:hypothetical protein AFLA70_282g001201 [Aspergillus flavus AF70]